METTIVILGTAHLETTPGKCSPDKRLREYSYSREIVDRVAAALKAKGIMVAVDYEAAQPNASMKASTATYQGRVRAVSAFIS